MSLLSFLPGSIMALLVIAAVILMVRLLFKPIKWAFKLLINAAIGFVLLFVVNFLGAFIGIEIAITWITALIAGIFGIPGVIAMLLFQLFF